MVTVSGKKAIAGLFVWSRTGSAATYTYGTTLSGGTTDCYKAINSEYSTSTSGASVFSGSGNGIAPGTNTATPTEDETTVPSDDRNFAGLTYVSSQITYSDAKYIQYVFQNNTEEAITVNCTYYINNYCLMDHTLLDEPVVVEPTQKAVFTYRLGVC